MAKELPERLLYASDYEEAEKAKAEEEAEENKEQPRLLDLMDAAWGGDDKEKGTEENTQEGELKPAARLQYKSDEPPGPSVVKEVSGNPLFDTDGYDGFVSGIYYNLDKLRYASLKNFDASKSINTIHDNWDGMSTMDADLEGSKFENISLRGSLFNRASLIGASFKNSDLTGADFRGCTAEDLEGCDFSGCDMSGVKIDKTALAKAITTGAKLANIAYTEDE